VRRTAIQIGVVAVAGFIIFQLCAPRVDSMRQRAEYERTLQMMKLIDARVVAAQRKNGFYPATASMQKLAQTLDPSLPITDAWGNVFTYRIHGSGYVLATPASDGAWDHPSIETQTADGHRWYDADIIVRNSLVVHGRYAGVDLRQFRMRD
jgi:hypothetical protein